MKQLIKSIIFNVKLWCVILKDSSQSTVSESAAESVHYSSLCRPRPRSGFKINGNFIETLS